MKGNSESIIALDSIDRRILAELQANGALSHADLAQRVGSSTASFAARQRLVSGRVKVADRANEIVAILTLSGNAGDQRRDRDGRLKSNTSIGRPGLRENKLLMLLS